MGVLKDYPCEFCYFTEELFEEDFESNGGLCPKCGNPGLHAIISGANVKTSSKTSSRNPVSQKNVHLAQAGFAIRVTDKGELGEKTPLAEGQVVDLNNCDSTIITTNKVKKEGLEKLARVMKGKEPPSNKTVH